MKDRHDRWAWNLSRDLGGEQAAGLINVPGVAGGVYSEKTLSLDCKLSGCAGQPVVSFPFIGLQRYRTREAEDGKC